MSDDKEVSELKSELEAIRKELGEIKAALCGPLGMTGIIGTIASHEDRLRTLENERWWQRGVAAGIGAIAAAAWQWITSR
jgi:hypothetical protein